MITRETVTTYGRPETMMFDTSHGMHLTYLQWCQCEAARITATGTLCGIVWNDYGYCAVAELRAAGATQ